MFKLFKRKSKLEKLNRQYENLLKEAHRLSAVNRKASDEKVAEANRLVKEIELLQNA
jgi:hypothetical protein